MASRTTIARAAVDTANMLGWPLFVGNGFLCREVMALAAPGDMPVLPLQGGMGLAGGVAAGYLLAWRQSGAVVLEGDGNHAMGWGCAQLIGDLGIQVIHIVSCNGVYRTTGGQPVPGPVHLDRVHAAAATLDYRSGLCAATDADLDEVLRQAMLLPGPTLVYVTEDPAESAPPRRDFPSMAYARVLAQTASRANGSRHVPPAPSPRTEAGS